MNPNYKIKDLNDLSKTGIYKITCLSNNKVYIGSACSIKAPSKSKRGFYGRWHHHLRLLTRNIHRNKHLQNAFNLYGESNFIFEILEFSECNIIEEKEIYYINYYNATNHNYGFNMLLGSLSNIKEKSIETRQKISKALKGRKRPYSHFKTRTKPVLQFKLDGSYKDEFLSLSDAYRKTGVQRQDIGKCCNNIKYHSSAGGYIWKFKEKDDDIV